VRSKTALVAILLLASSTFMMRGVLRAPASLLQDAYDGSTDVSQSEAIGRSDQEMVVALVARNADLFTSNPGDLQWRSAFPGWIFFGLIVVGLLDRLRGPRFCDGEDPRTAMLLAVGIILSSSTYGLRVPGTAVAIPSILNLLSGVLPGLDAVRALGFMSNIVWVPLALIAGYGARAVLDVFGSRGQQVRFVSRLLGVAGIRFWPALSVANFGRPLLLESRYVRPPEADIALLRSQPISAFLHLPMAMTGSSTMTASPKLLLGSFWPSPTTSCYNSSPSPYAGQIGQLARRLPEPASSEALAALGIDTLLFHKELVHARAQDWFEGFLLESAAARERMVRFGATKGLVGYRLQGRLPRTSSTRPLHRGVAYEQVWEDGVSEKVRFWTLSHGGFQGRLGDVGG
jgi:hypothetical protein